MSVLLVSLTFYTACNEKTQEVSLIQSIEQSDYLKAKEMGMCRFHSWVERDIIVDLINE